MMSDFQRKFEEQVVAAEAKGKPSKLVAVAGLHPENFAKVALRGEFTSQSIAITKTDRNYNSFGSIAVLFKAKEIFNGERSVNNRNTESVVATGDYYSARTPELYVEPDKKQVKAFMDRLLESKYDSSTYNRLLRLSRGSVSYDSLYDMLARDNGIKEMFLEDAGLSYDLAYKRKPLPEHSVTKFALGVMKGREYGQLLKDVVDGGVDAQEKYINLVESMIEEKYNTIEDDGSNFLQSRKQNALHRLTADEGLASAMSELRHLESYQKKEMIPDDEKNKKRFNAAFKKAGGRGAFQLWVTRKVDELAKGYHSMTDEGKKLSSWDALDRHMKRNRGEGKERTTAFGVGELRAMSTRRLCSFTDILDNAELINTDLSACHCEELSRALDSFKGLFWELSGLPKYYDADNDVMVDRGNVESIIANPVDDAVKAVMKRGNIDGTPEDVLQLRSAVERLKGAYINDHGLVPYFEAVEHRSIPLSNDSIEAILVPKECKGFVEGVLADQSIKGVKIKTYNPEIEGAMFRGLGDEADIRKHSAKLDREHKKQRSMSHAF